MLGLFDDGQSDLRAGGTMNAATELVQRLDPGTRVVYVENSYFREKFGGSRFDGVEMTVLPGRFKWVKDCEADGTTFRMKLPSNPRQVEWLAEDTVRYQITGHAEVKNHTVTLRFVS